MKTLLYPEKYYEAKRNFEKDVADIKRNQFEVSYSIFYGQVTDSVTLDITNDLIEHVEIEIRESFNRNFKSF